ncbi:hypothetical protein SAMN05216548_11418 [Faunimonas pinastri]|uniref:Uncharacterized protein n=1 Tax=Faunimonas pinastri TaxID=1855383 RepID=A0A1H9MRE7_9HYPH|nr:hypothetical protein [Faunimonas pinastri]SER26290.1 hypothetical protein SAMN05216548_11418 [Faunimonas pinastri]
MGAWGEFNRTPKQEEIMTLVLTAAHAGEHLSLAELKEKLSYGAEVTKQAVQCSIRFLVKWNMVEKEYRSGKLFIKPTLLAYKHFRKDETNIEA